MKYCSQCGAGLSHRIPEGDDRPRFICDNCNTVHYENPRMVVGCIPEWGESVLFCRRAIEPRYGKWTLPAGFLEKGETVAEGAIRETHEEAGTKVEALKPFALYNLAFIGQVYLMFRGRMVDSRFLAGDESLEVRLFRKEEVPWNDLAFPVIRETLRLYFRDREKGLFTFHTGDITTKTESH